MLASFEMIRKYTVLIVSVLVIVVSSCLFCGCEKAIVRDENSFYLVYTDDFKIMQLADIQVDSVAACDDAFEEIDKMVQIVRPDLIILTGDNVDAYAEQNTFETLVKHMEKYAVYWAPVFGNHDDEQYESLGLTKNYMACAFENAKYCLFNRGPTDINGVGNYVINLVNEKSTEIFYSLVLMDSNTYRNYETGLGWDYIYPGQIDWFERAVNNVTLQNHGVFVPTLTFFHIPLMEFEIAKNIHLNGGNLGWGELREEMGAPMENTGMFAKMKELNNCLGVICGHAHINNCDLIYENIHLICGLKSSRYSYYNEDMLGCTVYSLNDGGFQARNVELSNPVASFSTSRF